MCVTPNRLPNGVEVACHKCWQCRENRINDWVGRCIAEKQTATATNAITLTYGTDPRTGAKLHERAAVLTYSDLQKYFKLLRRHGYPCRYFATGEYGSLKGRAHWHVVIFWQGRVPEHKLSVRDPRRTNEENEQTMFRFMERHWPHGWSEWEEPNHKSIRYVCKYLLKDHATDAQSHLAMSKKPPLGAAWFDLRARKHAESGLAPQSEYYSFDEARDANGRKIEFFLRGVSLDNYCAAFLRHWRALHGDRHPPQSQLIEDYCDRVSGYEPDVTPVPFLTNAAPWEPPPEGYAVTFSDSRNTYVATRGTERLFWSYNLEGQRAWQNVIRTEAGAVRERAATAQSAAQYREATGRPPSVARPRTTGATR